MAGERERYAFRHFGENIGLVREQNDRIVGRHLGERAGQIVDAAKLAVAEPVGELVAEAGEPEAAAGFAQQHGVVFHHRDAHLLQRRARFLDAVPPVVIAENRIDAERRAQTRKFAGPGLRRQRLR